MRLERRGREIPACHASCFVGEKGIEDFIAEDQRKGHRFRVSMHIVGKFFFEAKRACGDSGLEHLYVLTRVLQIFFGRCPGQGGPNPASANTEVELNSVTS